MPQEEPAPGLGCLLSVSTLTRPSSTRNLPALFHAGNVRGVVPFRGPDAEPNILSDAATLLWLAEASTPGLGARQTLLLDAGF